ncbi:MAG: hypothetical protein GFH27_549309n54 [Chloroflexi bacterium AL-W]|nr:hypothetical protein [Chloroflexi bacterium AL-N1]NOK69757.1 hypothetical protein [Chloroflexi bacterium AL-N10]NOK73639.1 hypothetical protein [Chloroflexi bacterium AL-N5]NOK83927.1 hypothetical protein [Chloroflexi bacterium AL-W]NOK87970.1 hypothetical protein [Chloroflexi bacterium AL-N15]
MRILWWCVASVGASLFLIKRFVCVVHVQGISMEPTFVHGDRVVVLSHWPQRWLQRGQIVVFAREPEVTGLPDGITVADLQFGQELVIKRLIGLPDDTVVQPCTSPDGTRSTTFQSYDATTNLATWHIPAHHGFVKGDGTSSFDSVQWGPIPLDSIQGVVIAKLPYRRTPMTTDLMSDTEIDELR